MIMVPTAVIMDYLPPKRLTKLSLSYHFLLKYSAFWLEALRFRYEAEEEIALKYVAALALPERAAKAPGPIM